MPANLRGWEILVLLALILLLFGAKRLPDAARGLGRSLRIFKSETKGLVSDSTDEVTAVEVREAIAEPQSEPSKQTEN